MSAIELSLWFMLWMLCCGPMLMYLGAVGLFMTVQKSMKAQGLNLQYDRQLQLWVLRKAPVSNKDATVQG